MPEALREELDRLRAALTAAERRLALVQAVAGMGSWYVEQGSRNVQFSPETYRVLGLDPAQGPIDAAAVRARVHPEDLPELRLDRDRILRGEGLVTSRFRFRRDDGSECWLESRVTLVPEAPGMPQGFAGTVSDVSDIVHARQELERRRDRLEELVVSRTVQLAGASERAEVAARAKSTFLAHASHELRNPLNIIVSMAHLLRANPPGSQQFDRVQALEQAARQLSAIIDSVLDLAQTGDEREALPLPLAAPAPAPLSATAEAAARLRERHARRRVLLAEDDPVNQLAMLELLSEAGLEVDTADDGMEAVDMASRRSYALVILDLRMPRLDGIAAARTMRTLPGLLRTPLIAVSANTFEQDRQACRDAGMDDFLPKPVQVQQLYELLLRWLDHQGPLLRRSTAFAAGAAAPAARAAPARDPSSAAPGRPQLQEQAQAQAGGSAGSGSGASATASPAATAGADVTATATATAMEPLLGLEGVDAMGGLGAVGGKPAVYRRLLGVFSDTHRGDGPELRRLQAVGDLATLGARAHRVRGSAATLGLIDVEMAAAALERAVERSIDGGHGDPALPHLAQALDEALGRTLATLSRALQA